MASIIKFGSLVMNGEVCPFPTLRDGKDFWLGDTAEKHQIHWLVVDNKLVCCWNLITRLSWEELEAGRVSFARGPCRSRSLPGPKSGP